MPAELGTGSARLRVLVVLPTLGAGGAERVILTLLRHIDRSRFETTLIVLDGRVADLAGDVPGDIDVVDLRAARLRRAIPALIGQVRARRPHVLLSTLGYLNLAMGMLRPLLPRSVRLIGREASVRSAATEAQGRARLWRWLYRRFYPRLDLVICQSRSMQLDLCAHFGVPRDRTVIIPNPLDLERVRALAAAPIALAPRPGIRWIAAGRLAPEKGFDLLLDALAECRDLPWVLDLLGRGPEDARLREQAQRLGLQDRVRMHGFVANPYPWLRGADALVLSSRYEGLPNVVLEALACGTPVIATPVPPALEILTGLPHCELASAISAPALALALRNWWARDRARMSPDVVDGFEVRAITARYEEALASVAQA